MRLIPVFPRTQPQELSPALYLFPSPVALPTALSVPQRGQVLLQPQHLSLGGPKGLSEVLVTMGNECCFGLNVKYTYRLIYFTTLSLAGGPIWGGSRNLCGCIAQSLVLFASRFWTSGGYMMGQPHATARLPSLPWCSTSPLEL